MGYAHTNGNGGRALAALAYFGLLEREGRAEEKRVRLTPLAQAIVMDERPDSSARAQAIRQAALSPKLYATLWEELADGSRLPSDANLEFELKSSYGVNKDTVSRLVRDLRSTLEFAGITGADGAPAPVSEDAEPVAASGHEVDSIPPAPLTTSEGAADGRLPSDAPPDEGAMSLTLTLEGGGTAQLRMPAPLSAKNLAFVQAFIAVCAGSETTPTDEHRTEGAR